MCCATPTPPGCGSRRTFRTPRWWSRWLTTVVAVTPVTVAVVARCHGVTGIAGRVRVLGGTFTTYSTGTTSPAGFTVTARIPARLEP